MVQVQATGWLTDIETGETSVVQGVYEAPTLRDRPPTWCGPETARGDHRNGQITIFARQRRVVILSESKRARALSWSPGGDQIVVCATPFHAGHLSHGVYDRGSVNSPSRLPDHRPGSA